ncbi:MAG: LacI family DNA-binding transcriptional regulator [Opitutaceae bacterium]|nr:LacI family DNA-binding transcriptional regulator [Opitutaceae bacterium]
MSNERPVTLRAVARAAGVSVSAASYALRGAPNIPADTVAKVRAAADSLGYRPNARVAELMSHIRGSRRLPAAERLALVWPESSKARDHNNDFTRKILNGARTRAATLGYRLDEFWLEAVDNHAPRLAGILRARGIAGVVFAPVSHAARVSLDWPWAQFAMAVVGTAEWNAPLSRAAHHHYEAMRLALSGLARTGARRPAALVDHETNERAHRGWQGAWLAYAPPEANTRLLLTDATSPAPARMRSWLRDIKPDALVVDSDTALKRARAAGWRDTPLNTATLSWRQGHAHGGVDQGYDLIAAHAVDLVVAQLHRNERGLPGEPRTLLFAGRWIMPAEFTPAASAQTPS